MPRLNAPSRKVTDPLGVLPPHLRSLTVAVKVTGRPRFAGLGRAVRTVGVAGRVRPVGRAGRMVTVTGLELLEAKVASPLYVAVMASVPGISVDVVRLA